MEKALKWSNPRTAPGSFLLAVGTHALLLGSALALSQLHFQPQVKKIVTTDEMIYETFSAPPAPSAVPKAVARMPETKPEQVQTKTDSRPKELQDSASTVSGTQAAAKAAANPGAEGAGDAATTPYYKIKPKYPRAALVSGVEGWILLKVDINEQGEVENVRVIGGEQRNMFQDEARRAVEKWKYKPFLGANGAPVKKIDHQVRVDFKLTDAAS